MVHNFYNLKNDLIHTDLIKTTENKYAYDIKLSSISFFFFLFFHFFFVINLLGGRLSC
jgi:hypothetical protein